MIRNLYLHTARYFLALCCLFCTLHPASAQIVWSTSAGSAWLTGSNWTGGVVPGSTQVAQFNANPTSASTGVGINMDTAGGSYAVEAIYVSPLRTNALIIGNSAPTTPGVLTLNGATVNGTNNVILSNLAGNTARLTIQNTQGSGASTMTINTGSGSKAIVTGAGTATAAGNTISLATTVTGTAALTFMGGGTWDAATATGLNGGILRLGSTNTFSGGITVGMADGSSSGILELDSTTAISNVAGNNIIINPNSQLYLAATSNTTFPAGNIVLHLSGNGNGYTTTGKGALINLASQTYTWDGPIVLDADAGITAGASGTASLTLTSAISGPGALIKQGASTLVLQGVGNSWAGGTTMTNGKLVIAAGSGISTGALALAQLANNPQIIFNNTAQTISNLSNSFTTASGNTTVILNGTRLTIAQSTNTTYGNGASGNTGTITGTGSVVKTGTGRLTLTSTGNTFSGGLKISAGELRFNPATGTTATNTSPDTLDGGTLSTNGISRTVTFTFGTLALTGDSYIDLGSDTANTIKFANSSAITWTSGKTLIITNWTGAWNGTAGTKGRVFTGNSAAGVTATQLAQIKFRNSDGYLFNAAILSTGELVPVAPTITTTAASYGPFCNSTANAISVAFTATGSFTTPFLVQLSDASGIFTNDFTTNIIGSGTTSPISASIPAGTPAGTAYRVRVINASPVPTYGSNNGSNITITGAPVVPAISGPSAVPVGGTITLTDATSGGTWSSASPTIATVNATSGVVSGLQAGTATISYAYTNFCGITGYATTIITVMAIPAITAVTPNSGIPGSVVTITGSNFNTTPGNNIVFFGGVQATVTAGAATSLTVTVPVNAGYARILVTDAATGQTAYERNAFTPTYTNTGLMTDSVHFKPRVDITTGSLPIGAMLSDLDGDGKPDLVVSNSGPANLYIYRNTGTGAGINSATFASPQTLTTGVSPHYLKIADLNGDGRPDIVVANTSTTSNSISIYRNTSTTGSISFTRADVAVSAAPIDMAFADFDGDGRSDIAVVAQSANTINILQNNSTAGALTAASFSTAGSIATGGTTPYKIFAGDLDADGKPDIAVTNYSTGTVGLLHNTSSISAISFSAAITLSAGSSPTGINGADIDGDGLTDLVVTNSGGSNIAMLRNTNSAAGTLSYATAVQYATPFIPEDVAINDLNGDGKPDLAVGNYGAAIVSVFRNTATTGTFTASTLAPAVNLATGEAPAGLAWNDIDGDAKPDLAVLSSNTATLHIFRNYPLPPVGTITGADSVCTGTQLTLSATVTGGHWASLNNSIATVTATGVVYGVASGIDTIAYYTIAQGDTNYTYHAVTVGSLTTVAPITATMSTICMGAAVMLQNAASGGSWTSASPAVASVDTNGFVSGIAAGTAIISYTTHSFCGTSYDTATITVTPGTGYTIGSISGPSAICTGITSAFTDTSANGVWSSGNDAVAAISTTGTVQGIAAGTTFISYTVNTACGAYLATHPIMVDTVADASVIAGPNVLCMGVSVTFTDVAGGVWSTGTTGNATITASGVATGLTPGIDTVTYTVTNSCGIFTGYKTVVVNAQPDAGTISGPSAVCLADTITFTTTIPGGTWTLANTHASSLGNGNIKGITVGVDTVYYTISNTCGTDTASAVIAVQGNPAAGTLTVPATLCVGSSATLASTVSGGVWSSLHGNAAITDSIVTGAAAGTDTIRYTVTNACGSVTGIKKITINAVTSVDTIAGPSTVCTGTKITLTNATPGGTWSRSNTNATVSSTGLVTGVTAGIDTIMYTPAGTCPVIAAKAITIYQSPFTGTITGPTSVCLGDTIVLGDTVTGGVWSGTNGHVAVSDSFITGVTVGADTVKYTITTAMCGATSAIKKITVNPLPYAAPITGTALLYVGDAVLLHDSTGGGAWSVKGANAIISAQGKLGGLKEGVDTVRYTVTNGCGSYIRLFPVTILSASNGAAISAIELYPNPTSGKFTVKLISTVDQSVSVLIAGTDFRIISLNTVNTNTDATFDLDLADGVYFLSALSDKGWFTTRFVIVR